MTVDELTDLLVNGDRSQVLRDLLALTDSERKALGPKARRWLTHGTTERIPLSRQALAVLATAGGARQAALISTRLYTPDPDFDDDAALLLKERNPSWLPDLVTLLLGDPSTYDWRLVRALVRAGAVPAPDHPEYYRGTVFGLVDSFYKDRVPLADHLRQEPGLIGDHLFAMLSVERAGRALATHDGYREPSKAPRHEHAPKPFPDGAWRRALDALQRSGELDRQRLLDVVLAAPLRDWAAADLAWYVGMHDLLAPTLDEVADRQGVYTRLLTVEHGPSVKAAQSQLLRLLADRRFEPEPFLDASRATLGRSDKASVSTHLRLLEKLAKARPDTSVVETVRTASEHPRADVRDQAAKLLTRLGADVGADPEPTKYVAVAPVSRPPASAVHPIASPDELADVLLSLLEEVDPLETDRAIDGLLRFADERPTTADLLLARATAVEFYIDDPRLAARVLTLAWLTPRKRFRDGEWPILLGHTLFPADGASPETFVGAIGRRLTGVAQAIRGGRKTSVALPTSTDFSLDPRELSRRLREQSRAHPVPELEIVVALLRVPARDRASVVVPRPLLKSPAVALAREGRPPAWLREVAAYQRNRWDPERRVPVFRDERGTEGHAAAGILARSAPQGTAEVEADYGDYDSRFEQTLALGAALLPHDHDVLAAHAHPYLHRDLRKDRACCVPIMDAIGRAGSDNGPPASSALVLGLAAKDARGRTAAQDAILDLIRYGHLDGRSLGRQAALLLTDDIVVGQRVCSGLAECARASDAAAVPVLDALREIVAALPGRRDAGAFLELAADLAERTGGTISLPPEFHEVAAGTSSSMLAKASRRLLRA